jgi:hypothetical protein
MRMEAGGMESGREEERREGGREGGREKGISPSSWSKRSASPQSPALPIQVMISSKASFPKRGRERRRATASM